LKRFIREVDGDFVLFWFRLNVRSFTKKVEQFKQQSQL
jgi:hypothetical protein